MSSFHHWSPKFRIRDVKIDCVFQRVKSNIFIFLIFIFLIFILHEKNNIEQKFVSPERVHLVIGGLIIYVAYLIVVIAEGPCGALFVHSCFREDAEYDIARGVTIVNPIKAQYIWYTVFFSRILCIHLFWAMNMFFDIVIFWESSSWTFNIDFFIKF